MRLKLLQNIREHFHKEKDISSIRKLNRATVFLNALEYPIDIIDRSYKQYLCHQFVCKKFFLDNLIAKLITKRFIKSCLIRKIVKIHSDKNKKVAVFFDPLGVSILPNTIKSEYSVVQDNLGTECLIQEDIAFIEMLQKRFKKDYFFVFKIICKIAQYRMLIEKYNPSAIIATSEYSFSSSVLTQFCRINNVKHINVMHGEKLFDLRSSFFEFDSCYVWDLHYEKLFLKMKAKENQFIINSPESILFDDNVIDKTCDVKFFLERETVSTMKKYSILAKELINSGKKVIFRPHPRYTNVKVVLKYISKEIVEDFDKVSIVTSIKESRTVVARCSTVLYQAYKNNISVTLDDVTNPQLFNLLDKLDYIMINRHHLLLSEVLDAKLRNTSDII